MRIFFYHEFTLKQALRGDAIKYSDLMAPFVNNLLALRCQLPRFGCTLLSLDHLKRTSETSSLAKK